MKLEYRSPTPDDIISVARNMRAADVLEVAASHGHSPLQALTESVTESTASFCAVVDGEPVCIFGIAMEGTARASVWLLGTDRMPAITRLFIPESRRIIGEWLKHIDQLYNYVDVRNALSRRWLRKIGFTETIEVKQGPANQPFVLMVA